MSQPGTMRRAGVAVNMSVAFAEPVDGAEERCTTEVPRPLTASSIVEVAAPVAFVGPTWQWRWLSGTTGV